MRLSAPVLTLVIASVLPLASRAAAEVRPQTIQVVADGGGAAYCAPLSDSLRFHFKSRQRLQLSELPDADHVVTLKCAPDAVDATWKTRLKGPNSTAEIVIASVRSAVSGDPAANHPSLALALTQQLFDKLPWDGEINAFIKPRKVKGSPLFLGPTNKDLVHTKANVASGYVQSISATNCSAFEIAFLKKASDGIELEVFGEGAFTSVGTFASPAEVYLDRKAPAGSLPVFRLILAADARSEVRKLVARCKKTIGEGDNQNLSHVVSGDLGRALTKEAVEINMVQQRGGAFAGQFKATNGVKIPLSVMGFAQSRADIGDYFVFDARALRSVVSRPYQPDLRGETPAITMAEGFAMFRYQWDDVNLTFGPGLFLSKINAPYLDASAEAKDDSTEPNTKVRNSSAYPALALGFRSEVGDFIADSQFSGALSAGNRFLSIDAALSYRLTETWFVGSDVLLKQFSDFAGAPGGRVLGVGGHVGFLIKRTKQEARHK